MAAPARWPDLVFAGEHDDAVLSRAVARGTLRRLARGVYTGNLVAVPESVVRDHLWRLVAHEFPGAVIADRSVRSGGLPVDGRLFVVHPRQRPVSLPGVTIHARPGPGPLPGDMELPDGLWISSTARALLDNLTPARAGTAVRRTLERPEVEEWLEQLIVQRGEDALNRLRDDARALAPDLGRETAMGTLDGLISAALATGEAVLTSPALTARRAGLPYDQARVERFAELTRTLDDTAPETVPALPADEERRRLLPFYEAYFSNFIEGTEFTIDEAAAMVFDGTIPPGRPDDAHDILGTYQIVSDPVEMARTPHDADELEGLLRARHAILMASRTDKSPGQYKERANRAGSTEFVAPDLVAGTLRRGFDLGAGLTSPFARAVYVMFLVTEVHPFTDGNGRVARIMMNAELVGGGEVRIVIPTVYRANYLAALKGATHTGHHRALIAMLSYARRYSARVNWTDRASAEADLERTHAFRDATEAESAGIRLTLP